MAKKSQGQDVQGEEVKGKASTAAKSQGEGLKVKVILKPQNLTVGVSNLTMLHYTTMGGVVSVCARGSKYEMLGHWITFWAPRELCIEPYEPTR